IIQEREIRRDDHSVKLASVTNYDSRPYQGVQSERVLNWLRRDEFSTRGLDEVLLSIRDREEAVRVKRSDITRLEPAINEGIGRFFRPVPIPLENRWAAHQDFSIVCSTDFYVRERLAHGTQLVSLRRVNGNHGRRFGKAVTFMDANDNSREPFGEFSTERRAPGNEDFDASPQADSYM